MSWRRHATSHGSHTHTHAHSLSHSTSSLTLHHARSHTQSHTSPPLDTPTLHFFVSIPLPLSIMRNSLLDGDVPSDKTYDSASSYSSAGGASSSGLASYFSADETKTVTRRTFTLITLTAVVLLVIAVILGLALVFRRTTVVEDNPKPPAPDPSNLAANIQSADLMTHLNALQSIAMSFNKTRVITLGGFNASVDYIYTTLQQNTNYKLQKQYFPVERWYVNVGQTSLTSFDSDGTSYTYEYGNDYMPITNSGVQGPNVENSTVAYVANGGCMQADWDGYNNTVSEIAGQIAIVERFDFLCNFSRQAQWAQNYGAIGLIVYNTENNPDLRTNLAVTQYTRIPVFLTTFQVGNGFWQAAQAGKGFYITMNLNLANTNTTVVTNIIADTTTGDVTSTVVVGSHMDSVQAGPGVNDNGSGSSANLAMALQVDKMLKAGLLTLPNRIRFMWYGAEEQGLLGSRYHVQQAQQSMVVGERTSDYAVMVNYDMLGERNREAETHTRHTRSRSVAVALSRTHTHTRSASPTVSVALTCALPAYCGYQAAPTSTTASTTPPLRRSTLPPKHSLAAASSRSCTTTTSSRTACRTMAARSMAARTTVSSWLWE